MYTYTWHINKHCIYRWSMWKTITWLITDNTGSMWTPRMKQVLWEIQIARDFAWIFLCSNGALLGRPFVREWMLKIWRWNALVQTQKLCQANLGEPVVAPHHGRKGPPEDNQDVIACRGSLKIIVGHFQIYSLPKSKHQIVKYSLEIWLQGMIVSVFKKHFKAAYFVYIPSFDLLSLTTLRGWLENVGYEWVISYKLISYNPSPIPSQIFQKNIHKTYLKLLPNNLWKKSFHFGSCLRGMVETSWIIILIQLQWKLTTLLHRKSSKQSSWKEACSTETWLFEQRVGFFQQMWRVPNFTPPILQRTWSQSFLSSAATTSLRMSSRQAAACPNFTKAGPKAWKSSSRVAGCHWFLFWRSCGHVSSSSGCRWQATL